MGCPWPTWPNTSAVACTRPRRCWSAPGPLCVVSTARGRAMTPDPLDAPRLPTTVGELRRRGTRFREEIATGVAVRQALLQAASGNLIELFEPLAGYHERPPDRK